MSRSLWKVAGGCTGHYWQQHREASLNWLALGLLLAAWNASDDDAQAQVRRPQALRGYSYVSVRAAALHAEELRALAAQNLSDSHKRVNQL
jgi:hypothetical protein